MTDLTPYNTLHVPAKAKNFLEITTPADLAKLNPTELYMFLGHGANILFTQDFPGTIAKVNLTGRQVISQTDSEVTIEVGAGENWHDLVTFTVDHGWSGLENMALIPGTVGAAAVGNIAAFGGNQEDVFDSLTAIELASGKTLEFSKADCQFAYRESFFKHHNRFLITSVRYRLSRNFALSSTYRDRYTSLETELARISSPPYTPKDIYQAVINIRRSKLPNQRQVGTAGSFFKNPLVSKQTYLDLSSKIPELQWYPAEKLQYTNKDDIPDVVKIPAGRLLDELGWKGKTLGRVSTSPNQALYVINLGGATGAEIYEYSEKMRADIKHHFHINLDYEVLII